MTNENDSILEVYDNDSDILKNNINYSTYKFNNWKKVENNEILNAIEEKGGAIWINRTGNILYRHSINGAISRVTNTKQANNVFSNYLGKNIKLIDGTKKEKPDVYTQELKMVESDRFDPFQLEEFFQKDGLYYRNLFKPSYYLQLDHDENQSFINIIFREQPQQEVPFEAIKSLISHLVDYDYKKFKYVINWLAYFFQGLKKSQVALVLRGDQGAGKGIFFKEIIQPLFGEQYCTTINDKSLQSAYLGGIVANKLFFNLDEISHKKAESQNIKNFLKALVTNDTITVEKKFETLEDETKIFGQVLITSNEPYVLDIEPSDRRYTIFTTSRSLSYENYLGYGNYEILKQNI